MSIPIICTVCRKSMKVGEGFTEPKKIRCSGCGTVILLTPNPANPSDVAISFPRKKEKNHGITEGTRRVLLYLAFATLCIGLALAFWWSNRRP